MMTPKIALLSDIHGHLPALLAVLQDLKAFQPQVLAVAGDLTGGPHTNEVLELLKELSAAMILGNSDLGVLRYLNNLGPEAWRTLKQFGLLRWNARNLTAENIRYLSGLPEQRVVSLPGTHPIRLVHGSPRDPFESICPENDISVLDLSLEMIAEPVMVCGHTHKPWHLSRKGKLAVNPGAVTGPLNGEVGAQYVQLEWLEGAWQVKLKTIAYDLALIRNAFVETGLLDEAGPIGRCFLLSIETGRDASLDFLTFAYKLAEQGGIRNGKTFSDEIWDLADRQYLWSKWTVNQL